MISKSYKDFNNLWYKRIDTIMFDMSRIINKPSKRKTKKKGQSSRMAKYAKRLNKNVPKSELWFRQKWESIMIPHSYDLYQDKYNHILGKFICDVCNIGYKYVIEIDGSYHNDPAVKLKDSIKDFKLMSKGYTVFRIEAYNNESFDNCLEQVKILISKYDLARNSSGIIKAS